MATYELVFLYFLIGSTIPLSFLLMDRDSVGFARLSAGLEDDDRFFLGMFFLASLWPVVIAWMILLQLGVIKRDW
jgi:hypothetical protein